MCLVCAKICKDLMDRNSNNMPFPLIFNCYEKNCQQNGQTPGLKFNFIQVAKVNHEESHQYIGSYHGTQCRILFRKYILFLHSMSWNYQVVEQVSKLSATTPRRLDMLKPWQIRGCQNTWSPNFWRTMFWNAEKMFAVSFEFSWYCTDSNPLQPMTVIAKSCHNANFIVPGGTAGCHNDNLHCRLSSWQPAVPPGITKLSWWQFQDFSKWPSGLNTPPIGGELGELLRPGLKSHWFNPSVTRHRAVSAGMIQ